MKEPVLPTRWRRRTGHRREEITQRGATDEFPGLGRVEQLVVRGDGLTTTSLEILTGDRITVEVQGHWSIVLPTADEIASATSMNYGGEGPAMDQYIATAYRDLASIAGEEILVREVLLVGPDGTVHGSAEVVARLRELPAAVADALASTDQPIGRLLRDYGVLVTRELRRWGPIAAGAQAARLGPDIRPQSRVLGRTYVMRLTLVGTPLASLTERFAPHVFATTDRPVWNSPRG